MGNHATRIRRHTRRHGLDQVEDFIDAVLSLDNLIDLHAPGVRRRPEKREEEEEDKPLPRLKSDSGYMDSFINPPDYLESQKLRRGLDKLQQKHFPEQPERDVLLFLMENAPLENWQYDILDILREEAYYFAPQAQTKIMNEGWASYIHSHLMTTKALTVQEVVDYADHHSGTVAVHRGRLNPYKLGLELFRDIEDRWNRGAFGSEYEEVDNYYERKNWDRKLGLGREKVFEVRKIYNDVGFIDAFLTEDFVREHGLFSFDLNKVTNLYEIRSRDFEEIKKALLFNLTNRGQPILDIVDGNYSNRGELYLKHRFEGMPLDTQYSRDTMINLLKIWGRPVTVETMSVDGEVIKLGVS
jgi:stage V sporulation protein R